MHQALGFVKVNEQTETKWANEHINMESQVVVTRKEGAGRGWGAEMGERSQVYGDGWKLHFWQ